MGAGGGVRMDRFRRGFLCVSIVFEGGSSWLAGDPDASLAVSPEWGGIQQVHLIWGFPKCGVPYCVPYHKGILFFRDYKIKGLLIS